jgi:tRNA A-37 threonylcarbamoyl transferase component Bud32
MAPMAAIPIKGSASFEQICKQGGLDSPLAPDHFRLHTPKFQPRPQPRASGWGSKGCSSSADTDASQAVTGQRGWVPPPPLGEIESPAAPRKQQPFSEQQRRNHMQPPSAPQKENSKMHKRHSAPPLVGNALTERDASGDEMPDPRRALDMSDPDPHNVNQLSLSPMNMTSPACVSAKLARTSAVLEAAEERRKRQRRGMRGTAMAMVGLAPAPAPRRSPASQSAAAADEDMTPHSHDSPPVRVPPRFDSMDIQRSPMAPASPSRHRMRPLSPTRMVDSWRGSGSDEASSFVPSIARGNSMRDTKLLFVNKDQRSASFCDTDGGFKFDDHFIWLHQLGSGSFSDVYAVHHNERKNEYYAIKRSRGELRSKMERAEYLNEVKLANSMPAHPNVVEYYRAWQDASYFYVQMELCTGGTLGQLMHREGSTLSCAAAEPRIWEIIRHIARGLAHIHSHAVIHCDIKPDNILISSDGVFKIGDLGQAAALKSWNEQEGDARYLSRDLLECNPYAAASHPCAPRLPWLQPAPRSLHMAHLGIQHPFSPNGLPLPLLWCVGYLTPRLPDARRSFAADIFSFGMVVYELRSGEQLPGSGDRWVELRSGSVGPPSDCGAELAQVIRGMMDPDRLTRPSAEKILQACCAAAAAAALKAAGVTL